MANTTNSWVDQVIKEAQSPVPQSNTSSWVDQVIKEAQNPNVQSSTMSQPSPTIQPQSSTSFTEQLVEDKDDRSVNDLIKEPKWITAGNKIYQYEEGKPFNAAESGYDSPGDWLADRHSSLNWNLTDLGFTAAKTALNIDEMPDDVKEAWVKSLQDFDTVDTDLKSTMRAFKNTGADPLTWGSIIAGFGVGGLAKLIGGRAATTAAKFELKQQLIKELAERGVTQGSGLATEEIVKEARKEAVKTVAINMAKTAAASGATYAGGADIAKQSLEADVGVIDPETGEIKQPDRLQTLATIVGGAAIGAGLGKYGTQAFNQINKSKAISEMTETINKSPNHQINLLEVTEAVPGEPIARHAITEFIAKVNTNAGRLFNSTAAFPAELARAAIKKSTDDRKVSFEIRKSILGLNKAVKKDLKEYTEEQEDDLINRWFRNEQTPEEFELIYNSPKLYEALEQVKNKIDFNESTIGNYFNLDPTQKLGVRRKNGETYITRTFLSENNPFYLEDIKKALSRGTNEKVDAKFINKVEGARTYFTNLYGDELNPKEINGMILGLVSKLSKPQESGGIILNPLTILNNIVEESAMSPQAKNILKNRKNLSEPILNLLGEDKSWKSNVNNTLGKQRRLLNEMEYLSSIDAFFKKSLQSATNSDGVHVELGGLIPKVLPRQTAQIAKITNPLAKEYGLVDVDSSLFNLVEESLGKEYANKTALLKDLYTSPQMVKYIQTGLDFWGDAKNPYSKGLAKTLQSTAALGQATQTIADIPAYLVNLYGAGQSFLSNGHFLNPSFYNPKNWKPIKDQLKNQYAGDNPEATKALLKLKEHGVIDSDLSAEIVRSSLNKFRDGIAVEFKSRPIRASSQLVKKGAKKTLGVLSEAYGASDTASKIMAHNFELLNLKKIYKTELAEGRITNDELFEKASEIVRNTMPSYGVASPAARQLSKFPFGTYALFPSEIIRTHKNIVKLAINDIKESTNSNLSTEAQRGLALRGLQRLSGLGTVTAGIGIATSNNNRENGFTNQHNRVIDMISQDYGKGQNRWVLNPPTQSGNGPIMMRFANSSQTDAADLLKLPLRQLQGRIIAGEDIKPFEVDGIFDSIRNSIIGPYTSPKFLYDSIARIAISKQTKGGKPLYSELKGEEGVSVENIISAVEELYTSLEPGTVQVLTKGNEFAKSNGYENLIDYFRKGYPKKDLLEAGKSTAGFPQNMEDIKSWMYPGIRPTTMNFNKAIGYKLSEPLRQVAATQTALDNEVRGLNNRSKGDNSKPLREIEFKKLLESYKKLQESKYQAMLDVSDKVSLTLGMPYSKRIGGKIVDGEYVGGTLKDKTINYGDIISMTTDKFFYKANEKLIQAGVRSALENAREGIVISDTLLTKKNIKLLREKFGPDYMSSPSIQEILKLSNKARVINLTPNASKKSSSDSEPFLLFPKG